ncbi:MAG: hypothetical protein JHD33_11335, partial [Chthoniobacterales bacterium]|nr:hypothetical protein [Chthoniobacterales bacterium]
AARGELVAFASHDDLWEPDKLRRQAQAFRDDPLLQLSVAHVRCFLDDGLDAPPEGLPDSRIGKDLPGWLTETVVARRAVFDTAGYFDEAMRQAEDTEWLARARDFPVRWKMQPETLVLRRVHAGNLTYRRDTREQGVLELLEIARRSVARKRSGESDTNVPLLLDVRKIRGNGRPARFLSDCTGETPMPPAQAKSLPAKGRWYDTGR